MLRHGKGFTLIELIMTIVLLGLLAVVAIPQRTNFPSGARLLAEQDVVGGVRSGIYTKYAANLANNVTPAFPATLDANANGVCVTCFSNVLSQPVNDSNWTKAGWVYTGPNGGIYTYTQAAGTFQ